MGTFRKRNSSAFVSQSGEICLVCRMNNERSAALGETTGRLRVWRLKAIGTGEPNSALSRLESAGQ
jgi:hypothetical protein